MGPAITSAIAGAVNCGMAIKEVARTRTAIANVSTVFLFIVILAISLELVTI